ncbi:unnamed protein product [Vitrella brassicaformis CCMP3155]|uniref:SAP domain-containing protein n=2 Tax=Vitrella brassicaformis TaxID=1169539 RepID=A0A0G4G4T0_VITBC|nr:unnamed protein product [Vitrella brassicaformis CCMP3155]|eukprot:CEM23423.1 unnamed protein product [Vitrella brassicaformis CCMP3155]
MRRAPQFVLFAAFALCGCLWTAQGVEPPGLLDTRSLSSQFPPAATCTKDHPCFVVEANQESLNGIYRFDGSGTAVLIQEVSERDARHASVADLNNDGLDDIVFCNYGTGVPQLFFKPPGDLTETYLQTPEGLFEKFQDLPDSGGCRDSGLGDFDGDGYIDLYITRGAQEIGIGDGPDAVLNHFYFNDGTGKLIISDQRLESDESTARECWPGDVDNDGDIDVFYGAPSFNKGSRVLFNDGDGKFKDGPQFKAANPFKNPAGLPGDPESTGLFPQLIPVQEMSMGDFTGDGVIDLILGNYFREVWVGLGDGSYRDTFVRFIYLLTEGREPVLADFNGDGHMDFYDTRDSPLDGLCIPRQKDALYFGDGTGNFKRVQEIFDWPNRAAIAADVNNDGHMDIVTGSGGNAVPFGSGMPIPILFPFPEGKANVVLLNDGKGCLYDAGVRLGDAPTYAVAVGKLGCTTNDEPKEDERKKCTEDEDVSRFYLFQKSSPPFDRECLPYAPSFNGQVEKVLLEPLQLICTLLNPTNIRVDFYPPTSLQTREDDEASSPPRNVSGDLPGVAEMERYFGRHAVNNRDPLDPAHAEGLVAIADSGDHDQQGDNRQVDKPTGSSLAMKKEVRSLMRELGLRTRLTKTGLVDVVGWDEAKAAKVAMLAERIEEKRQRLKAGGEWEAKDVREMRDIWRREQEREQERESEKTRDAT